MAWQEAVLLAVPLMLLTSPGILYWLVRRCEARAMARGELEPRTGEKRLRVLLVIAVLLMLFTVPIELVLFFWMTGWLRW